MKPAHWVQWFSLYSTTAFGSESESPVLRTGVIWKSGVVGGWITSRSGWLLELLTELIKGYYASIHWKKWRFGRVSPMHDKQTREYSATRLVESSKFKLCYAKMGIIVVWWKCLFPCLKSVRGKESTLTVNYECKKTVFTTFLRVWHQDHLLIETIRWSWRFIYLRWLFKTVLIRLRWYCFPYC